LLVVHPGEQFNERKGRLPIFGRVAHGCLIQIQQTDEHLADNPRADRAEAIAATSDVGFAQHVVPQRGFPSPSHLFCSHFVSPEGLFSHTPRDRLTRWLADALSAFEVTNGHGMKFLDLAVTRQCHRQRD